MFDVDYQNVILEDIVAMNEYMLDVATADGLAGPLVLIGTVLIVGSVAALGYLTLGAIVDLVTPS